MARTHTRSIFQRHVANCHSGLNNSLGGVLICEARAAVHITSKTQTVRPSSETHVHRLRKATLASSHLNFAVNCFSSHQARQSIKGHDRTTHTRLCAASLSNKKKSKLKSRLLLLTFSVSWNRRDRHTLQCSKVKTKSVKQVESARSTSIYTTTVTTVSNKTKTENNSQTRLWRGNVKEERESLEPLEDMTTNEINNVFMKEYKGKLIRYSHHRINSILCC